MEVVPSVLGVAVPQMQAQVHHQRLRVVTGLGRSIDDLHDVGVPQVVDPGWRARAGHVRSRGAAARSWPNQ